eukprot:scaffold13725_cov44-Cyclotella_meneghiniana.AAC.4
MTTSPEDMRAEAVDKAVDEARCCLICYEEGHDENGDPVRNGVCACLIPSCTASHPHSLWHVEMSDVRAALDWKHIGSHGQCMCKLSAVIKSSASSLEDRDFASNEVLSALEEFKDDMPTSSSRLHQIHRATQLATYSLGHVALGRKEPELAIEFFTKSLGCLRSRGYGDDDIQVMGIQRMIAKAERLLSDADIAASTKKILQLFRAIFEKVIEEKGENSYSALVSGHKLAKELNRQNQLNEEKELIQRLHHKSLLVLGSHHELTHHFEHLMEKVSLGVTPDSAIC